MKITLLMVMSLDGKTTNDDDSRIYEWTSKEDQDHFFSYVKEAKLIIMGRHTYEAAKSVMTLTPHTLRMVLTKDPEKYEHLSVPGQLEFSYTPPTSLITALEKRGYTQALLVGGESTNSIFLEEDLVTEILVTLEPIFFGKGKSKSQNETATRL